MASVLGAWESGMTRSSRSSSSSTTSSIAVRSWVSGRMGPLSSPSATSLSTLAATITLSSSTSTSSLLTSRLLELDLLTTLMGRCRVDLATSCTPSTLLPGASTDPPTVSCGSPGSRAGLGSMPSTAGGPVAPPPSPSPACLLGVVWESR